ncbi:MAG: 3-deoxy-D-manno-octulosonic acid transferase [Alphaproteobacteria bacterium]
MRLSLYRMLSGALSPAVPYWLNARVKRGKEDPARLSERLGQAGRPRPAGPLVWIHGASVGESLSSLPIIDRLQSRFSGVSVLVTTGTLTSARLLAQRLPEGAFHQFVPLDTPRAVESFLDHWRPDAALFMESELWPNLILRTAARGIRMALLNARMSQGSFNRWLKARGPAKIMLRAFDLCLAQDTDIVGRLESLGARNVSIIGNLKYAAPPLSFDERALEALQSMMNRRLVWLASSTHEGEERIVGHVHATLKENLPEALTLLVPRHPARGPEIAELLADMGHKVALRSRGEPITPKTDIYIADTLGELGLFYRITDIAFVGATLVPKGGHNPLEAARLNCAILYGPHTENSITVYRELAAAGAAIQVIGRDQLAREVAALFADPAKVARMAEAGIRVCTKADSVIGRTMNALEPLLASALEPSDPVSDTPIRARA